MPEQPSVLRPLINRAARIRDERRVPEIALKCLVMGAQGPRSASASQGDDVRVVGLAETGFRHLDFLTGHFVRGNLPRNARPKQLQHESARLLHPLQLRGEMAANNQAAVALLKPVQNRHEIRVWRAAENKARQVGVNDQAHAQPPRKRRSSSRKNLRYPGGALRMLP